MKEFLNTYLFPYIKHSDIVEYEGINNSDEGELISVQEVICFRIANGGLVCTNIDSDGGDIAYYANGKREINPRNKFQFQYVKEAQDGVNGNRKSTAFIEPYIKNWDGVRDHLGSGYWVCKKNCTNCGYCTKAIQLNNWEIPDDYPW